jgi:uncharacterized protein YbjT (DUF2867 family)
MRVLVTGGTGRLGRVLVPELRTRGHDTVVLSRSPREGEPDRLVGDLFTGVGVREALEGADVVVHAASHVGGHDDIVAADHVLSGIREVGARLVFVSIVGIDHHPYSYYRVKRAVEYRVERSGVPFAIQRATQFHDFAEELLRKSTLGPVAVVPAETSAQPVSLQAVATRLADLVDTGATGRQADLAGPVVQTAEELMRVSLAARRSRAQVLRVRIPGPVGAAFRRGDHLAGPGAVLAGETFAQFVARQRSGGRE